MLNTIYIGNDIENPLYTFSNDEILDLKSEVTTNLVGQELSIDTMDFTVSYDAVANEDEDTPDVLVPYATAIWWHVDGTMRGKFFVKVITRVANTKYKFQCFSAIGLMDTIVDFGDCYNEATVSDVITNIMRINSVCPWVKGYTPMDNVEITSTSKLIEHNRLGDGGICGITATIPDTLPDGESNFCFFGSSNGICIGITKDSARTQNQIDHETNLYYQYGEASTWLGNQKLPYLEPGTKHHVAIIRKIDTKGSSSTTFSPVLYVDGKFYENCIGSYGSVAASGSLFIGMCNTSTNYYHIEPPESSIGNRFTGLKIHSFTSFFPFYGEYIYPGEHNPYYNWYEFSVHYPMVKKDNNEIFFQAIDRYYCYDDINSVYCFGDIIANENTNYISPFTIDQDYAELEISGFLPYSTKRKNLYQVLFTTNGTIFKNNDGSLRFGFLQATSSTEIDEENVFDNGEISTSEGVSSISVAEHYYNRIDRMDDLEAFDKSTLKIEEEVISEWIPYSFAPVSNEPLSVLYVDASSLLYPEDSLRNCAKLSGKGSLDCYSYVYKTNSITKKTDNAIGKSLSVTDATLVNKKVSSNVMTKLFNYYNKGRELKASILYNGEVPGRMYTIKTPYGEYVTAALQKMTLVASSNIKANCEFIYDYIPNGSGGILSHSLALTGSGSYTFPEGILFAKVVIIGAGGGGEDGEDGQNGTNGIGKSGTVYNTGTGKGGRGGNGGTGGIPGQIIVIDIENPSGTITYSCGTPGRNYAYGGYETYGTITVASINGVQYSSSDGEVQSVYDPVEKVFYGEPGRVGFTGGDGGSLYAWSNVYISNRGTAAERNNPHEVLNTYGWDAYSAVNAIGKQWTSLDGSCGGGGAGGKTNDETEIPKDQYNLRYIDGGLKWEETITAGKKYATHAGTGGHGMNAVTELVTINYGCGGIGGHGGGGGGAGGAIDGGTSSSLHYAGDGGQGGEGSHGLSGGEGAVVILY